MGKIKIKLTILIILTSFEVSSSPLLLTHDYGILSKNDIQRETLACDPTPVIKPYSACNYWQCFPLKSNFNIHCTAKKPHNSEKKIQNDSSNGYVILSIIHQDKLFEFSSKRNYDYETCNEVAQTWQNVFENESSGCISAAFLENIHSPNSNTVVSTWEMSQLKTKSKHWSHFK